MSHNFLTSASLKESLVLHNKPHVFMRVQEGHDSFILSQIIQVIKSSQTQKPCGMLYILQDDRQLQRTKDLLRFFIPDIEIISFPAWDCQPYDRTSPRLDIMHKRIEALHRIHALKDTQNQHYIVLSTTNAVIQKIPPVDEIIGQIVHFEKGKNIKLTKLRRQLVDLGYRPVSLVITEGDFAHRGGILDVFSFENEHPCRIDFFGDTIENIKVFDVNTQKTIQEIDSLTLFPINELLVNEDKINSFAKRYLSEFGINAKNDIFYQNVNANEHTPSMEHYMPLFFDTLTDIFTYVDPDKIFIKHLAQVALFERIKLIEDNYEARQDELQNSTIKEEVYRSLDPKMLYLSSEYIEDILSHDRMIVFSPFLEEDLNNKVLIDCDCEKGRSFFLEQRQQQINISDNLHNYIQENLNNNRLVIVSAISEKRLDRVLDILKQADGQAIIHKKTNHFSDIKNFPDPTLVGCVANFEHGFVCSDFTLITENDVFGEKINYARKKTARRNLIEHIFALNTGDYIVHSVHGIGQFQNLITIDINGHPHECILLLYRDNDRLYLPVENLDMITRYGNSETQIVLDKLGGTAFQMRKAKLRRNLLEIAAKVIDIASKRELSKTTPFYLDNPLYEKFCDGFKFYETEDQKTVIEEVFHDLAQDKPMDRLLCGDAGFGKTEVAMRAAFLVSSHCKQVAILAPTTLLCRQHSQNFKQRFASFPIKIAELSRMTTSKDAKCIREELAQGKIDIVIGTHALLSKHIKFKNLGLVIVDEEQRFGVLHKEKLKELSQDIHILTLSATPIPRTLQMAFAGLKSLSIITTPPIDRLAIRSYVIPFDTMTLRKALLREHFRSGQSFFVAPRIVDLNDIIRFLSEKVPELRYVVAHGQMDSTTLDNAMSAFYEGKYDVLVSTTIIESGIDVPNANTIIIHKANMFGVSQLYQLRGRVGRAAKRGYAYFTTSLKTSLNKQALRRLEVLQNINIVGGGFKVASHDLDLRGGGNILGEDQSGHIKEVGVELFQQMLQEAIMALKSGISSVTDNQWSPEISLGVPVRIPETYIPDLDLRLDTYKRLLDIEDSQSFQVFANEIEDRFGVLPTEFKYLFIICKIKMLCKTLNIDKIESGKKGVVVRFYHNRFAYPKELATILHTYQQRLKLRADNKLIILQAWKNPAERLRGIEQWLERLKSHCLKS